MLLTGAPDFCAAAALFKITFIRPYEGGYIVQLLSLLEDKLLCVDCSAKEPGFVLLPHVSSPCLIKSWPLIRPKIFVWEV